MTTVHIECAEDPVSDALPRAEVAKMSLYEIRVKGHLDQHWSEWFGGLAIAYDSDGNTVLRGSLVDQAALYGVLIKVRDLALPLLAVQRVEPFGEAQERKPA